MGGNPQEVSAREYANTIGSFLLARGCGTRVLFCAILYTSTRTFAKTCSGQTQENLKKEWRFCRESALLEYPPTASAANPFPNATQFGWSPLVDRDYGAPLGLAVEVSNGSFVRKWSKATIYFDCHRNDSARFVFEEDDDGRGET